MRLPGSFVPALATVVVAWALVPPGAVASTAEMQRFLDPVGTVNATPARLVITDLLGLERGLPSDDLLVGENNSVTVERAVLAGRTGVLVRDVGVAAMIPSPSCLPVPSDPKALFCAGTAVRIEYRLGRGDDTISQTPTSRDTFITAFMGPGRDRVEGSTADDFVAPGPGADVVAGGGGRDALGYFEPNPVLAHRGAGTVTHAGSTDTISSIEDIQTGAGDDVLDGFAYMSSGRGDDRLISDPATTDFLYCGPGSDHATADFGQDRVDASECEVIIYRFEF